MKLTIKKQIEESVEIQLPAFFKLDNSFFGMFDEDEYFKVTIGKYFSHISSSATELFESEISTIANTWEPSTEEEFRVEYEKALKQIAIPRRQVTTGELAEETELLRSFH